MTSVVCGPSVLGAFAWNNSATTENSIFEYFSKKTVEKIQVSLKSDKNNGYFTWRPIYIFYHITFNSSLNDMIYLLTSIGWTPCGSSTVHIYTQTVHRTTQLTKNVWNKTCRQNQNTHFISNNFFRKSRRLWDKVQKYFRSGQATDDNRTHAHCMLYAYGYKHTLTIYNTVLTAFPLQQWLHERASLLHDT
jgi:hypothetical protein